MSSLYSTQRNNIMVCRCFSIDPADSKYCQNQFINTFRAKYPDLMIPLEGGGGYREMFFWDVFQQIVWFLREIYDIAHILSLKRESWIFCVI